MALSGERCILRFRKTDLDRPALVLVEDFLSAIVVKRIDFVGFTFQVALSTTGLLFLRCNSARMAYYYYESSFLVVVAELFWLWPVFTLTRRAQDQNCWEFAWSRQTGYRTLFLVRRLYFFAWMCENYLCYV